jgi:PEP-CTERM motif
MLVAVFGQLFPEENGFEGEPMKVPSLRILIVAALTSIFVSLPASLQASPINITITSSLSGSPGDTLTVTGNLTNNDAVDYFFIADEFPVLDPVLTPNDLVVTNATFGISPFTFGSASITAGATLLGVDLFTLQLAGAALPGSYVGTFQLYGDTDGSACSPGIDCLLLSSLDFNVNVAAPSATPEPSSWLLFGLGSFFLRRKSKRY